jgi:hypothetical protein
MLSPMEMRAMLEQIVRANSDPDLANDAREYLVLVNTKNITPEMIMSSLDVRPPGHEHTEACKH